ncbi:MAG: S24 family peptidase [Pseudomonadota bacterium]
MTDTTKDADYLGKLQDYYAAWKSLPSYARLCEVLGLASRSAVGKVLNRLREAGFLARTPDEIWVPTHRFFERSLAAFRVPAGTPATTGDAGVEAFAVDDYLIGKPSHTTLVPVKGDSMIDAGIFEGDIAVVEKRVAAQAGDIVVAIVDNEFTIKTLALERGKYVLHPANPAYPVIRPRSQLELFGVVVGIIRKYRS